MEDKSTQRVTDLLKRIHEGEEGARETLITLVYGELRKIATKRMRGERSNHTLQATGLVNEFVADMLSSSMLNRVSTTKHLYACTAIAMRRLLIDHHRSRRTRNKPIEGGTEVPVDNVLDSTIQRVEETTADMETLEKALNWLQKEHTRRYDAVMLHFYTGLLPQDIGPLLDVSPRTVQEDLRLALIGLREFIEKLK